MTEVYVPYSQRPGWEDVTPIPQADAPDCLVPIAYSAPYSDAMSTFRALQLLPPSERGIDVTSTLIKLNPGHYSIWAYRLHLFLTLKLDLQPELDLLDTLVASHLKSYQVWQHRKGIVLALHDPSRELGFTAKALEIDAKNYHTWAYRQWVLTHFFSGDAAKWESEIEYATALIDKDPRNNSAWNHRFFIAFASVLPSAKVKEEVLKSEVEYTKKELLRSPNNPSAWSYLRGILKKSQMPFSDFIAFTRPLTVPPPALGSSSTAAPAETGAEPRTASKDLPAPLAIEFLADALEKEDPKEAVELWKKLEEYDPIRKAFWRYKAKKVQVV